MDDVWCRVCGQLFDEGEVVRVPGVGWCCLGCADEYLEEGICFDTVSK